MEIIKNADTLLNEIRNNSFLTVNDNGEIVKESTFSGILRKIGDFFKNSFGDAKAITERQKRLDSAMNQMLSKSNLSNESVEGISKKVYEAFEKNALLSTVTRIKAMSHLKEVAPQLRVFVESVINDLGKALPEIGTKGYMTIMDNLMHTMTKVFKDIDSNNPDIKAIQDAMTEILNRDALEVAKNSNGSDFSDQFNLDVNRNNYRVNGKILTVDGQQGSIEEIKSELKTLFPNRTTRVFMSELLCQSVSNLYTSPMRVNTENNGIDPVTKVRIPDYYVSHLTLNRSFLTDEEKNDPNKPMYYLKPVPYDKDDCGFNLEIKRDVSGNITGATLIKDSCYNLQDSGVDVFKTFGYFVSSVKFEIDLKDPENPKITSTELSYGGDKKGIPFETRKENPEEKKDGPEEENDGPKLE